MCISKQRSAQSVFIQKTRNMNIIKRPCMLSLRNDIHFLLPLSGQHSVVAINTPTEKSHCQLIKHNCSNVTSTHSPPHIHKCTHPSVCIKPYTKHTCAQKNIILFNKRAKRGQFHYVFQQYEYRFFSAIKRLLSV